MEQCVATHTTEIPHTTRELSHLGCAERKTEATGTFDNASCRKSVADAYRTPDCDILVRLAKWLSSVCASSRVSLSPVCDTVRAFVYSEYGVVEKILYIKNATVLC